MNKNEVKPHQHKFAVKPCCDTDMVCEHCWEIVSVRDICHCGDYRYQHENGIGKCRMADDMCHGFKPCNKFRLSEYGKCSLDVKSNSEGGR